MPARVPPLSAPVEGAEDKPLSESVIEVVADLTVGNGSAHQLLPNTIVGGALLFLAGTQSLGDLTGITDRGASVVGEFESVSKVNFYCSQDPIQRGGIRWQGTQRLLQVDTQFVDTTEHHRFDEIIAGREVVVDRRRLEVCMLRDIGQSGTGKAFGG